MSQDQPHTPPEPSAGPGATPSESETDYGYERIAPAEKTERVRGVFRAVAGRYDLMNDVMSLGTHRLFKRLAVEYAALRPGHRVLDVAGGTGDLARLEADAVGAAGTVVLADINDAMLLEGRDRLLDEGRAAVAFVQADAEALPFADETFDAITIAFGFRNVARRDRAAASMHRVLRPGGRIVILEFSRPADPLLARAYQAYRGLWPTLGRALVGDGGPYRYLTDSIDNYPDPPAITGLLEQAGFARVRHHPLGGGVASIHRGFRV